MSTQALASNNPGRASREIREPAKFLRQVDGLGIPPNLRSSFKGYYEVCGSPIGPNPELWVGLKKAARKIGLSHRTMKRHARKWKDLGLVEKVRGPNSDRRSNTLRPNLNRIYAQDWPDGICPRCRHKHTGEECGCQLTSRHWPKKGWVERRCRCVPRPSEHSDRIGPQRVETSSRSSAPPEAPPPVQQAARPQPSPAAPARETETFRKFGSRAAREARKLRVALFRYVADNMRVPRDRYGHDLSPGDEGYRLPMPRDQAIREACVDLALTEPEGRELLKFGEEFLGPEKEPEAKL